MTAETEEVAEEPVLEDNADIEPVVEPEVPKAVSSEPTAEPAPVTVPNKPYEEMTVEELQAAILERMAKNGPVTEQMKKDVTENIWHDSLVTWIKSFN